MNCKSQMHWLNLVILPLTVAMTGCSSTRPMSRSPDRAEWTFDDRPPNLPPPGWWIAATNPTAALATWHVLDDASAPSPPRVFALTESANYDGTFNLAVAQGASFGDLDLSVRVKAVSGEEDQGGGPIWRCQDEDNYYICRFNPLEGNFRMYVVANGKRRQLKSVKLELSADRWYEVRVRMIGNQITCYLDEDAKLTATDDTIARPGRIGLWTKADAVTSFDDLRVRTLPPTE
jgi:hypothetical protein